MDELMVSVAEASANFSKIATTVSETGRPVTILRNSSPWVATASVGRDLGEHIPAIDWATQEVVAMDRETRVSVLPADWDDPEDDGLYDGIALAAAISVWLIPPSSSMRRIFLRLDIGISPLPRKSAPDWARVDSRDGNSRYRLQLTGGTNLADLRYQLS